jgi:aldehyde dehydrogenase (NAD+)
VERGAHVLCGGARGGFLGYYMQPTVLENVSPEDEIYNTSFLDRSRAYARDFEDAVGSPTARRSALPAPSTRSAHRIEEFIVRYRAGLVSINGPTYGAGPHMPFGGVKNSGNGFREPGTEALDVYCEWKTVVVNHDPTKA